MGPVGQSYLKPEAYLYVYATRLNPIPQWPKPRAFFEQLAARINLCPFKTLPIRMFSVSFEVVPRFAAKLHVRRFWFPRSPKAGDLGTRRIG